MSIRHLAYVSLFLLACSGGGGFIPKKDGGNTLSDGGAHPDLAINFGDGGMCSPQGQACGLGCCQGLSCTNGTCQPGTCKSNGTGCMLGDNCCQGLVCNSIDQICEACGMTGHLCEAATDCCNGLGCPNGSCQPMNACAQSGQSCANATCCQGLSCNGFTQLCGMCGSSANAQCASDADCCVGQGWNCNLNSNQCAMQMMGCAGNGAFCNTTADCCNQLYCQNNGCTAAPTCKVIGGVCNSADANGYMVCCESASMDCVVNKCCIETMYQDVTMIKCHQSSDCCSNEVCNVNTGMCG